MSKKNATPIEAAITIHNASSHQLATHKNSVPEIRKKQTRKVICFTKTSLFRTIRHPQNLVLTNEKKGIIRPKWRPKFPQKIIEKNEQLPLAPLGFAVYQTSVFNSVIYSIGSVLLLNHYSKRPIIGAWSFWVLPRGV